MNFENMTKQELIKLIKEYDLILDNIPQLVFYKDTTNSFIRVNRYLADFHKINKLELSGKSLYDLYPYDEAQKYWKDDLEVITSGKPKLNYEESWLTGFGVRWVRTSKIPFFDSDGKAIGILGISEDITERKNAENKLCQLNEELERKVKERTNELENLNSLLEKKNTALNELVEIMGKQKEQTLDLVQSNISKYILPIVLKMKRSNKFQMPIINEMETALTNVATPFNKKYLVGNFGLTSTELKIANLIKEECTAKEIAEQLKLSVFTVQDHIKNIRNKLKIRNKRINLKAFIKEGLEN